LLGPPNVCFAIEADIASDAGRSVFKSAIWSAA
jgi:hypothetical protein